MKPITRSKTIIFNGILGISGILGLLGFLPEVAKILPEKWQPAFLTALAVVNIVLRFMTHEPVTSIAESTKKITDRIRK